MLSNKFYLILTSYLESRHFRVKQEEVTTKLRMISAGVPQGSVLGPILYLIFTADLPVSSRSTMSTFVDDTAILTFHENPTKASELLQKDLHKLQKWLNTWRIKVNESKSAHVTFTLRRENCPPVLLIKDQIPQVESTKYLGMHLDRRLTWKKHIFSKRKQLGLQLRKLYWLIGRKSKMSSLSIKAS